MSKKTDSGVTIYSMQFENDIKCGCCNWGTSTLYSLATNAVNTEDLCAYCFLEMIEKNGWKIMHEARE